MRVSDESPVFHQTAIFIICNSGPSVLEDFLEKLVREETFSK